MTVRLLYAHSRSTHPDEFLPSTFEGHKRLRGRSVQAYTLQEAVIGTATVACALFSAYVLARYKDAKASLIPLPSVLESEMWLLDNAIEAVRSSAIQFPGWTPEKAKRFCDRFLSNAEVAHDNLEARLSVARLYLSKSLRYYAAGPKSQALLESQLKILRKRYSKLNRHASKVYKQNFGLDLRVIRAEDPSAVRTALRELRFVKRSERKRRTYQEKKVEHLSQDNTPSVSLGPDTGMSEDVTSLPSVLETPTTASARELEIQASCDLILLADGDLIYREAGLSDLWSRIKGTLGSWARSIRISMYSVYQPERIKSNIENIKDWMAMCKRRHEDHPDRTAYAVDMEFLTNSLKHQRDGLRAAQSVRFLQKTIDSTKDPRKVKWAKTSLRKLKEKVMDGDREFLQYSKMMVIKRQRAAKFDSDAAAKAAKAKAPKPASAPAEAPVPA